MPIGPSWMCVSALGLVLSLICSPPLVTSKLVNRTIDDEKGDSVTGVQPVYAPANLNWIQGTTCVHCNFLPGKVIDVNATFDGTWHDCTYHPGTPDRTITASFSGVAVYAFFTVPNFLQFTTTFMNLSFYVDDAYLGQFEHTPDASSTINYQVLGFHTTDLPNTNHTIDIRATGPSDSLILFDYMIYTVDDSDDVASSSTPSPTSSQPPVTSLIPSTTPSVPTAPISSHTSLSVGAIAGGVVGAIAVLGFVFGLVWFMRRRRRRAPSLRRTSDSRLGGMRENAALAVPPVKADPAAAVTRASPASAARRSQSVSIYSTESAAELQTQAVPRGSMVQPPTPTTASPTERAQSPRSEYSSTYASTMRTGESSQLRAQVATLREELARLHEVEEGMHRLFVDPPPHYIP
ncbi:hypothetical protein C8Q77DRAFT_1153048 [Trametes polyzona]|nr:hypothetical protein C8Q77DRAFT_1153048 [Trametes polyzona]